MNRVAGLGTHFTEAAGRAGTAFTGVAAKFRVLGWRGVRMAIRARTGRLFRRHVKLDTPDRRMLEDIILEALAEDRNVRRVLLVGSDWYCAHYPSLLTGCEVTSIDPDRRRARFGASTHIVDRLENLGQHVERASFDAIVCNGVYGWGLDAPEDCEAAFTQCAFALRTNGLLVLGWNDVPAHDPVPIGAIESLRCFVPYKMPSFGVQRTLVDGSEMRHTYAFYRSPALGVLPEIAT